MKDYNFDELQNFEVPEGWIERALDLPSKSKKKVFAAMFYRYAIGAAACLVLAAAVTFSLVFGFGKKVDLTNPDREDPYLIEQTTDETSVTDQNGKPIPAVDLPRLFGESDDSSTYVTEPAETDAAGNKINNNLSKSKQPSTAPTGGKTKSPTRAPSNPASVEPGESEAKEETAEIPPEEPETLPFEGGTEQPTTEEPCTNPNIVHTTEDIYAERDFEFYLIVFNGKAKGDVFCKLVDKNGVTVSSGAVTKTPTSGKTKISYNVYMKLNYGDTYSVVFYNSNGVIIKQSTITYRGYTKYNFS